MAKARPTAWPSWTLRPRREGSNRRRGEGSPAAHREPRSGQHGASRGPACRAGARRARKPSGGCGPAHERGRLERREAPERAAGRTCRAPRVAPRERAADRGRQPPGAMGDRSASAERPGTCDALRPKASFPSQSPGQAPLQPVAVERLVQVSTDLPQRGVRRGDPPEEPPAVLALELDHQRARDARRVGGRSVTLDRSMDPELVSGLRVALHIHHAVGHARFGRPYASCVGRPSTLAR